MRNVNAITTCGISLNQTLEDLNILISTTVGDNGLFVCTLSLFASLVCYLFVSAGFIYSLLSIDSSSPFRLPDFPQMLVSASAPVS